MQYACIVVDYSSVPDNGQAIICFGIIIYWRIYTSLVPDLSTIYIYDIYCGETRKHR